MVDAADNTLQSYQPADEDSQPRWYYEDAACFFLYHAIISPVAQLCQSRLLHMTFLQPSIFLILAYRVRNKYSVIVIRFIRLFIEGIRAAITPIAGFDRFSPLHDAFLFDIFTSLAVTEY